MDINLDGQSTHTQYMLYAYIYTYYNVILNKNSANHPNFQKISYSRLCDCVCVKDSVCHIVSGFLI